ncbi:MAG: MFS transporter [Chloroflexi bacterium]|nr:MFS transporter [Chloroflexota bacterium]MBI3340526.1 MFS transporter [Chloroflexota bacterium]
MFKNLTQHYIQPIRSFNRPARLFLLMTILDGVILSGWQLFFNFYMLESGFTRDFLGLVNSMPSAAGLIFGIFIGRISDRIGRKASILIGITMASVFMVAQITFRQPAIIAAAAFLTGVFNMLFIVSQAPLMVKLSNAENRTMLFSLNYGLQTIAGAVGSLFAGQLPAIFGTMFRVDAHSATAYQAVLISSVLLGTVSLIPIWMMDEPRSMPEANPLRPGPSNGAPRNKLSSSLVALTAKMTVPQILIGLGAAILIPYMNVFFKDRFAVSDSTLGTLFSLSALLIGIGNLLGPRLATRLGGKVQAVVASQFASLIFLLIMGFTPFLWLSSIGFLMRSALMNMASPLYTAFCMEHTPENQQGFVNSILSLSWNIGWAVGPYISGIVQERYGFTPLFITTAILYFAAIAISWNFFVRMESRLDVAQVEQA